jgi:hypothetical protein
METNSPARMDRRSAIKWMLTAAASVAILDRASFGADGSVAVQSKGYGPDPDLLKVYKPGDLWPLTFNAEQRQLAIVLCDLMIPADATSPKASDVGVHDFIDEWISSPYPGQAGDRKIVLEGLAWIDEEADRRYGMRFTNLIRRQQTAILDDICDPKNAKPEYKQAVVFFKKYRDLTAGGYYTTPEGMRAIGYVGNVPLAQFDGPPPEVLKQIGLL